MCIMTTVVKSIILETYNGSLLPPKRKVKFALRPIIIFIEDDEDRKGPWELFAVDRDRFNRRIVSIEKEIGWCFKPEHREKVFNRLYKP